jgi:hypothetical protein
VTSPVDLLREQLWGGALSTGDVRIGFGGAPPGWREQESYWAFPSATRAQLFLPAGSRRVTSAAALHYRGLRQPTKNLGRGGLGAAAFAGLPLSAARVGVWVRSDAPEAASGLPLTLLERELRRGRLYASFGVRAGANRKATMQLLDETGTPVGYAKLGWSAVTDAFVRNEARTLREVGGRPGPTRAPALLAEVANHGHPIIVTEPLPLAVRGAGRPGVAAPTSQELHALTPVVRHAAAGETRHVQHLAERLDRLRADDVSQALRLLDRTRALTSVVLDHDHVLPVTQRWHGDLAPWNLARDNDGALWAWDWENSEEDAVAGLDALHWAFSKRRAPSGRCAVVDLPGCLQDARPHLVAAGVPRARHGLVAATYALAVLERALDLVTRSGTWETSWIRPQHLEKLIDQAATLLGSRV